MNLSVSAKYDRNVRFIALDDNGTNSEEHTAFCSGFFTSQMRLFLTFNLLTRTHGSERIFLALFISRPETNLAFLDSSNAGILYSANIVFGDFLGSIDAFNCVQYSPQRLLFPLREVAPVIGLEPDLLTEQLLHHALLALLPRIDLHLLCGDDRIDSRK